MSDSDNERRPSGAPASWLKSNLAALGSAAVFTVYSAGFVRTRAAAAEFSDAPIMRRAGTAHPIGLRPIATRPSPRQAALAPAGERPANAAPADAAPANVAASKPAATEAKSESQAPEPIVDAHTTAAAQRVASAAIAAPSAPGAAAPARSTAPSAPTTAPVATHTASPAAAPATTPATQAATSAPVTASAQPAVASASSAPVTAPAPASNAAPAPSSSPAAAPAHQALVADDPARGAFKDGTYLGWGTSRHGDIQAKVVVQDGWIVSATIAQCLTQYACSWIDQLPPEVTARQSADVDYVSGATQSSNAFYGAVQQAIAKAQK